MPRKTTKEEQVFDLARKAKILRVHELIEKVDHPEHLRRLDNEACWCEWADARDPVLQEKVSRRHLIPIIPISLRATFSERFSRARGKAVGREREYSERWLIEVRCFRSALKRDMNFVWDLSRDLVKGKSRDQTDYGVGIRVATVTRSGLVISGRSASR